MNKLKTHLQFQVIVPLIVVLCMLSAVMVWIEYHVEFKKLGEEHLNTVRRSEWLMYKKINDDARRVRTG